MGSRRKARPHVPIEDYATNAMVVALLGEPVTLELDDIKLYNPQAASAERHDPGIRAKSTDRWGFSKVVSYRRHDTVPLAPTPQCSR